MTKFLASAAAFAGSWLVTSWMTMVIVGVVHAEWIRSLPTIGFGLAMLLAALMMATALFRAVFGAVISAVNGLDS